MHLLSPRDVELQEQKNLTAASCSKPLQVSFVSEGREFLVDYL